jgi:hypothetical protein
MQYTVLYAASLNHGPFGKKNIIIPNGRWHYGPPRLSAVAG